MPKLTFDTKAEWDQAVENVGIQTDNAGCVLSDGATPLVLADDFNDGVRSPLWKGHTTNSLIAQFDPAGAFDEPLAVAPPRVKLAQTFILPIAIQLSRIELKIDEFNVGAFSPDLIVEIQGAGADDRPNGTVYASTTVP